MSVAAGQAAIGFELGQVLATPGALQALAEAYQQPATFLRRHLRNDWGDLSESDKRLNDRAVRSGEDRIFSSYHLDETGDNKIWIITEWDRSATTILLPEEY